MKSVLTLTLVCICAAPVLRANWPTFGGDPQRSGWAKEETEISRDTVKQLRPVWTLKLDNQPRELNTLTPPIAVSPVYTDSGVLSLAIVGGSSDNLFVIDADTGKLVWHKHFENTAPSASGSQSTSSYFCPQALNDTPAVVHTNAGYTVYVISIDGKLHALNLLNGEERFAAHAFVPPYSKNWSLNVADNVVYTSTSQGCAGTKSAVWAMDLGSPDFPVTSFAAGNYGGGGIWGRGGVAISPSGTIFATTGDGPVDPAAGKFADSVLALSPKTLQIAGYFTPTNANYITRKDLDMGNSTPVIFTFKEKTYLVTGGKEGVLVLLDAKSPGGETHRKPLYQTPLYVNAEADIAGRGFWGAFASWQDEKGVRWVYAPAWGDTNPNAPPFPKTNGSVTNGSIMAFRVDEDNGSPVLKPAWISRDMNVPEPPVIANGIVFALSSGEFTRQISPDGHTYTSQERRQKSNGHAILYGFDATTGEELFSSGPLPSLTHLGGLAVSAGRVLVTLNDGTVICFGVPEP